MMKTASREEQIKALSKISKAIASDLGLKDILRLVVTVTAQAMGSNTCSIMLLNEKTNELVIMATQNISEEYIKKAPLKFGEGIAGRAAKLNKPIVVKDVTKEKEYKYRDIAQKQGLKSLLCMPLAVKGKVTGVINCYTSHAYDFKDTDIEILTAIANQAAVAIENAELLTKSQVIQEELEERKKLERAKGILMKEGGISEEEAYLKIRKYSMDTRKSMGEVADAIIMMEGMKRNTNKQIENQKGGYKR
ncbi:MAG: GAF domain-containing protein [Candidatus Omnitrophota bacterium]